MYLPRSKTAGSVSLVSKKPFRSYHAPRPETFLAVGENAELGVFGEKREIQALDGLAAFVRQFRADAAFVFEAGNFMASGAAVVLDQFLAVLLFRGSGRP